MTLTLITEQRITLILKKNRSENNNTGYSFLPQAEQTPSPLYGRKAYVNEKFQRHHRESKA